MNQTQFNLLSQLNRAPERIRTGEIAHRTVLTGPNGTAAVDDLERLAFVTRQGARDDRRAIVIRLTRKRRRAFAEMAPIHAGWIESIFAGNAEVRKEQSCSSNSIFLKQRCEQY